MRPICIEDAARYIAQTYGRERIITETPGSVGRIYESLPQIEQKRWTDDEFIQGWVMALHLAMGCKSPHEWAARKNYLKKHRNCPQCGTEATMPEFATPMDVDWGALEIEDRNAAACGICGWSGTVHGCVAPKE